MAYERKLIADHSLTAGLCSNNQAANFIAQYLIDHDPEAAAERIGLDPMVGYALIRRKKIQQGIRAAANRRPVQEKRAEQLLDRTWDVSSADPRELVAPIYVNCRYCWGERGQYQRTKQEMLNDKKRHYEKIQWIGKDEYQPSFDLMGGDGYSPVREPNPQCSECGGKGTLTINIPDSRQWSSQAAALFDGVEMTQYGPRIKLRSRDHADTILSNNLGITRTRVSVQLEKAAENPARLTPQQLDEYLESLGVAKDVIELEAIEVKNE